jgi:hypothetical protein
MRINQSNNDGFDGLLKAGLKNHGVKVSKDFTERLLTRIQRQEYAAALAAIKLRERLLLGVMILLPIAAVSVALLLPHQIMIQFNALIVDFRQMFLFSAAKVDFVSKHWIEVAAVGAILVYILFDFVFEEN